MAKLVSKYGILLLFTLMFHTLAGAQNIEVLNLDNSSARVSAPARTPELSIGFANDNDILDPSYGNNAEAMKEAEQLLYNEWQYVLKISKEDLMTYICDRVEKPQRPE